MATEREPHADAPDVSELEGEQDGYELAAKIRSAPGTAPRLFALTGYGQPTDRERARQAGFAAHFVKPVDVKQLIETIASE